MFNFQKTVATAALAAVLAMPAYAQMSDDKAAPKDDVAAPATNAPETAPRTEMGDAASSPARKDPAVSLGDAPETAAAAPATYRPLDDVNVVTSDGEVVGEVDDAVIDAAGKVVGVSVEVGGFLGIGEKDVVIDMDKLKFINGQYVTTLASADLENMPDWKK
jgi:sporulation protein YlmC with PRC-barrel domain